MATTMKSNDSAIRAMQDLLQGLCLSDPAFAIRMANPNKSMEGAVNFLCNQVKNLGVTMLDDKTVLGIVAHYFDEPNLEEDSTKPINCNIVVSKPELSDEDKAELREQAMKEYKEEQLRAIRRENQPKSQAKATSAPKAGQEINVEPNLFGEDF